MECPHSWLRITSCLDPRSLVSWIGTCRSHRTWFLTQGKRWRELQAGVAMSRYIHRHVHIQVQVHAQEMQSHSIPRSDDPRVPPRVETVWIEHGAIPSESMSLPPVVTSVLHHPRRDVVTLQVDCRPMAPPPMLVHTVHGPKCLYSVIRVLVTPSSTSDAPRELRRYVYHKHNGDLSVVSVADKRKWSVHGRSPFRYDVLSIDGSCQMELHVPAHLDAMVDCYHIQHVGVLLSKSELFPLPPPRALTDLSPALHIHLTFFDLTHANLLCRLHAIGSIVEEAVPLPSQPTRNPRTAAETLQVFTATVDAASMKHPPPSDLRMTLTRPGIMCLNVSSGRQRAFRSVALHGGTSTSSSSLSVAWVPGVLEYALSPQTLTRRNLKGSITLSFDPTSGAPVSVRLMLQYLEPGRRQQYAVAWRSSTGLP
ncbi:hypothetical protein, variant [Aphanomyces astaci]|uniref:Uncharacterized protein n=1 Tax=Aphanomyces astaci TaxID=112090 RepID=W4HB97_APHAT|nr:hypothetical protein, variant [Aphanomyces astaci]ETV89290.1 hypothetical protein, variant [Aphanomyces astaci]|eukprot:XP_009821690.1 hypothetical protein, variant [Aphanomyces astaci]